MIGFAYVIVWMIGTHTTFSFVDKVDRRRVWLKCQRDLDERQREVWADYCVWHFPAGKTARTFIYDNRDAEFTKYVCDSVVEIHRRQVRLDAAGRVG